MTHYDDLDLEFVKIEHKSFSEIISNQSCSPALDKKERQGWIIFCENLLPKVYSTIVYIKLGVFEKIFRNKCERISETSFSPWENNFCWSDGWI